MKSLKFLVLMTAVFLFSVPSFAQKNTPEGTIAELVESAKKSDWGNVYACFSKPSAIALESMLKGFIQMAVAMAKNNPEQAKNSKLQAVLELEKYSGKEFFIKLMEANPDSKTMLNSFDSYEIKGKELKGSDKVILTIKTKAKEEPITLIKENSEWKIDITELMNKSMGGGSKQKEHKAN